jgi:hypothetical protein
MNNIELELLTQKYINDVDKVCQIILQEFNVNSKEELINHRVIGEFYFSSDNKYIFHGRGCKFSSDELEIDWDFGYGDIWCGLDPWKLFYYVKDNKIDNGYSDGCQIKEAFDKLVAKGKMIKKYELYYFI